ncbi:pseudouridine synthase [Baffinella frigidus]|nr:pseudouridine synthase [Cryptophyta sp. CCMP2293]
MSSRGGGGGYRGASGGGTRGAPSSGAGRREGGGAGRARGAPGAYSGPGFRVVRCFPGMPRREADRAVEDGRVTVNGVVVAPSWRVMSGDLVKMDGKLSQWEAMAEAAEGRVAETPGGTFKFKYLKYYKPTGVACTTDVNDMSSLMHVAALSQLFKSSKERFFPIGRLDKDSHGLVCLTSDGRVADALLQPRRKTAKEYRVMLSREPSDEDLEELSNGVVITTQQVRSLPAHLTIQEDRNIHF